MYSVSTTRGALSVTFASLLIISCGGGGETASPQPIAPTPAPTPVVPTTPETCSGNSLLHISNAISESAVVSGTSPDMAIDGILRAASRWEPESANASLTLDLNKRYQINTIKIALSNGDLSPISFEFSTSDDNIAFNQLGDSVQSSGLTQQFESYELTNASGRYLKIDTNFSNAENAAISEILLYGCALDGETLAPEYQFSLSDLALDPDQAPGSNFDLLGWGLDTPEDLDNNQRSDRISETQLNAGFENAFFFTGDDGSMIFRSTIVGAKTSQNTNYTRSELRGMLRRGNTGVSTRGVNQNNWLLGYQPDVTSHTGGRNGRLSSTLSIERVTETGEDYQIGRVIIGQIHAEDDEPIRLYYRKLPNHERGYLYFAHELRGGEDLYWMVLGGTGEELSSAPTLEDSPADGIALNEVFSYEIIQDGSRIDVVVHNGSLSAPIIAHTSIDMELLGSGYDIQDEWMYFKAGAYSQNNSGDPDEFDQVRFYVLNAEHSDSIR